MDLDQLRAAVAEDERIAQAALEGQVYITLTITGEVPEGADDSGARALVQHAHRHDPARVLRWVRAAREILAEHEPETVLISEHEGSETVCTKCLAEDWPCPTVRSVMSVYGDTDG